jgi:stearoyl-CoA desaturase (delta-9 desaturase)
MLSLPPWTYVAITLVLTHITVVATTLYLHRHQAHRAIDLHPVLGHFFRFWLWLTTGTVTREWVAVHRKHHAHCETEEDPHSPQVRGIGTVLFKGAFLYYDECQKQDTLEDFGKGTPDDWVERNLYTRFRNFGLVLMWGYRSFETSDASRNIMPIGVIMGGEELHNNHHAYRQSARFSCKWWEFDIGWMYIRLFEGIGFASVKRTAPRTRFVAKDIVDVATVKAVVRNRYHVLKLYGAKVIAPVLRDEMRDKQPKKQLRRLRKWLVREDLELDATQRETVDETLSTNRALRAVVDYKEQLKALMQPTVQDGTRLAKLQEWCASAEATGIEALREFAMRLRGYSMRLA